MSQVFLFTGENSHALREELRRWILAFREKHGDTNYSRLSGSELTLRSLLDEVAIAPFIAEKRLVVVDGIPSFSREEVGELCATMHPDVVLLFVDPKPDKRLSGTKELLKLAEVKEFRPLARRELQAWAGRFSRGKGASIAPDACDLLLELLEGDQAALSQEIEKLSLLCEGREIRREDVAASVLPIGEQTSWKLVDLLAEGKREEALRFVRGLIDRGESPQALWHQLLWITHALVLVWAAAEGGERNVTAIARASGIHFMSVRALLPLAGRMDRQTLQALVDRAVLRDRGLKTGAYRATGEAPQELHAVIDEFLCSFASFRASRSF